MAALASNGAMLEQMAISAVQGERSVQSPRRKMRRLNAARRSGLTQAFAEQFGAALRTTHQAGGMHIVAYLRAGQKDVALVQRLSRTACSKYHQHWTTDARRAGACRR